MFKKKKSDKAHTKIRDEDHFFNIEDICIDSTLNYDIKTNLPHPLTGYVTPDEVSKTTSKTNLYYSFSLY